MTKTLSVVGVYRLVFEDCPHHDISMMGACAISQGYARDDYAVGFFSPELTHT